MVRITIGIEGMACGMCEAQRGGEKCVLTSGGVGMHIVMRRRS